MEWRCPVVATIEDEASVLQRPEFVQGGIKLDLQVL